MVLPLVGLMKKFTDGMSVEMCSFESGFEGAWFEGRILSCEGDSYKVRYDKFETDDGDPLVEVLDCCHIRPRPPLISIKNWGIGDAIEAYDTDCWWTGVVSQVLPDEQYGVYFPESKTENTYHSYNLRSRQDWRDGEWYRVPLPSQARSQNIVPIKTPVVPNDREAPLASSPKGPDTGVTFRSMIIKIKRNVETKPGFNMQGKDFPRIFSKASEEFDDKRRLGAEAQTPSLKSEKPLKLYIAKKRDSEWCKPLFGGNALDNALPLYKENDLLHFDNQALKRGYALKKRKQGIYEDFPYDESLKVTKSRHSELPHATCQTQIEIPKNVGNSCEPHVEGILFGGSLLDIDSKKCSPSTDGSCIAFLHSYRNRKTAARHWPAHDNHQKNNGIAIEDKNKLTVHELEANAYRSVLQAFHAQGPLNWERVDLLSILRLQLHITWEEHDLEVKKILSEHQLKKI